MRIDGQTDMTKLMVTFHNFANEPKKQSFGLLDVDEEIKR
jgi:hypothetical protein